MLGAAFITVIFSKKFPHLKPYIVIGATLISFLYALITIPDVIANSVLSYQMEGWRSPFGITIAVDSLNIVFITLVSFVGFLVSVFSIKFVKKMQTRFYSLFCLQMAGLLGVLHTGDIFNMFVFLEITNISSYALTSFYRNRDAVESSMKYLFMGAFSTSLILLGIAFIYGAFGTVNMADLAVKIGSSQSFIIPVSLVLLLSGFALKSGLFPFHAWLPGAYSSAPSHISAMFSGVVSKAGIYGMVRIGFTVFSAPSILFDMLLIVGVLSMIIGALLAFYQTNLKRMLAYSSISQMGYIAVSFGVATMIGFSGGILHVINHAIISSMLFLLGGIIIMKAGTNDMALIGSKFRFEKWISATFLIGVLSLAGVPLLNGFVSKWLIYVATFETFPILTILSIVFSIITLLYGLKAYYLIFMSSNAKLERATDVHWTMKYPIILLAAICIILGVIPWLGLGISDFVVQSFSQLNYIAGVLK
jgi:multicomponent Na+:H+ antiporter subunit D